MQVLATLAERTGDRSHLDDLQAFLRASSSQIASNPLGPLRALLALERLRGLDPARADALAAAASERPSAIHDGEADPVQVSIEPADVPGTATLRLRIPEGFHVNAHDPGDSDAARDLQGLRLDVLADGGVRARWPEGTPWRDGILVHTGEVDVPLEIRFPAPGTPLRLLVEWQTCDDRVCFRPVSRELEIAGESMP